MPPVVAAAIITGIAGAGTATIAAKSASGASKRATAAQDRAAVRAETFEKEQDALNRADQARRDAEDQRRWDTEQANLTRRQTETDQRTAYEDAIRYGKMVNLARLTGQPAPPPPPRAGDVLPSPTIRAASAPILSRPSTANASIPAPGAFPTSPLSPDQQPRMPISRLVGRRQVI